MSKNIGAEHRHQDRLHQIAKIKKLAKKMFGKAFPSPKQIPSDENFVKAWQNIDTELHNTFGAMRDYKLAFNHLVHLINAQKEENGWQVGAPSYLITQKATKQLRNKAWLQQAWAFQHAYNLWFDALNHTRITTPAQCYQALMLSFMCHSGHSHRHLVEAFSAQLNQPITLYQGTQQSFIPLSINEKTYNTNDYGLDGSAITQYHCYLSPLTLGLIYLWGKLDRTAWHHPTNQQQIYLAITAQLSGVSEAFPNTLTKLAACAIFVAEQLPNANISQALTEYAIGHTKSYSLPLTNLARITSTKVNPCSMNSFYDFSSLLTIEPSTYKEESALVRDDLFVEIAKAVKRDNPKTKLSRHTLLARLNRLTSTARPLNQRILLEWLIEKAHSCKPSTIATYHSSLTRRWLFATDPCNLIALDAEEFESLYLALIDEVKTAKAKAYLAARLTQLHGFGVNRYGLMPLLNSIEPDEDNRKHTRAGFIDEALFAALLTQVDRLQDINNEEKITLQTLLIIGYRCGLRLGELIKLQLDDIEQSGKGWVRVTSNAFGDIKTAAARRKVPLFSMLLKSELAIVNQHLMLKRAKAGNKNQLVFTLGQDSHRPIDQFLISNFTKHVLRELSGLSHLVFHHLRHSCLSRLQIMIEIEHAQQILPNAVPYSCQQEIKIKHHIFGKSLRNKYYALAAFAGHSSPETCFNSYFHFSDWILGQQLNEVRLPISKQVAMSLNVASRGHYQALTAEHKVVWPKHFTTYLNNKLKPTTLINRNTPENQVDDDTVTPANEKKYSIELCYTVLERLDQGSDIQDIAFTFRLNNNIIERWITNAKYIKELHTQNPDRRSRHFSPERQHKLVPGKLRSSDEQQIVSKWVVSFRQHYKAHREEINWAITYALNHTNISQSGVHFNQPSELKRFIAAVDFTIPKSYWRIITNSIDHSALKADWQDAYQGIRAKRGKKSSPDGRAGRGTARLELRHPNEKQIKTQRKIKKFSSHALMYLFHMMGIMMFK